MPLRHGCLLLIGCLTAAAWLPPGGEPARAGKPEAAVRTDIHGDPLPDGARRAAPRLRQLRHDHFALGSEPTTSAQEKLKQPVQGRSAGCEDMRQ
jgi:hypothetical protein